MELVAIRKPLKATFLGRHIVNPFSRPSFMVV
jgi:hypothetical protein